MLDYRIIRTNGNLGDLEAAIKAALKEGWQVTSGAPFRSESSREWCREVTRNKGAASDGELGLREVPHGKPR
jgi:hypothetical protein